MADLSALCEHRFHEAFGDPHRVEGRDHFWALRPLAYVAAVNVLLDCGDDHPTVWIFDPHNPRDGVTHHRIAEASQIDELVSSLTERAQRAGRRSVVPDGT